MLYLADLIVTVAVTSVAWQEPFQEAGAQGGSTVLDRIQASSSALQLEKSRLVVREYKLLHALNEHQEGKESRPSASTSLVTRAQSLAPIGLARSTVLTSREAHLRVSFSFFFRRITEHFSSSAA